VSFFEVFLLVLLEKNFSERRRRKILGGKKYSREGERQKKRKRGEDLPF
jgi:hypothetical protein